MARNALFVALWMVTALTPASAAEVKPGPLVDAYQLIRVIPGPQERVWVLPWNDNPATVETVEAKDGSIVFVGPPGRYAVLWLSPTGQGQTFVTIRAAGPGPVPPPVPPGPGPRPDPDPVNPANRPDGFAGEVFDEAIKVGDKATASRLADVCRQVLSAVAAGGMDRDTAAAELISRINSVGPPSAWKPFAVWFGQHGGNRAATLPQMRQFLTDCIEGLEAVAK